MGTLAAEMGQKGKAARLYREAMELDVNNAAAPGNLALLKAERASGTAEADGLWKQALAIDPDHVPAHMGLAKIEAAAGRWKEAAAEWQAVLKQAPKFTAARIELAACYVGDRQFAAAVKELTAAEEATAGIADWERIGNLYAAADDPAGARRAYAKAADAAERSGDRRRARELRSKSEVELHR